MSNLLILLVTKPDFLPSLILRIRNDFQLQLLARRYLKAHISAFERDRRVGNYGRRCAIRLCCRNSIIEFPLLAIGRYIRGLLTCGCLEVRDVLEKLGESVRVWVLLDSGGYACTYVRGEGRMHSLVVRRHDALRPLDPICVP